MVYAFNYQEAINELRRTYEVDLIALAIVMPDQEYVLKWKYISGNLNDLYQRITLRSGKGIAGQVFKTGKSLILENVHDEISINELYEYPILQFEQIKSCVSIPLFKHHRVKAVLMFASRKPNGISEDFYQQVIYDLGDSFGPLFIRELLAN
ncbi:GAF domain-containing protein [Paucisalibacillus globulus]|uniref:GAF domain-containing protein n=1 Tax=Paucisalibacillus globulus TaxID=351095 RepID=UPI000428699F|nr:GAF domain-containing protein [Paucisalibacillus globulus]